ncbi:MAG: TolB protein [Verrucomicrobiota bacterium]|jgi:TolB protein
MKTLGMALVVCLACTAAAADRHIAFERDQAVWIANLDGAGEKKITDGIFPAISPDGTRVAFTSVERSGTSYIRRIAVVDLATTKTNVFKDIPSDNAYYPSWSPDGTHILFTLRNKEVWDLGLIKPDGAEFRILKKGAQDHVTLYSPCWGRDGKSIFCQDMTNVYQVGLDGAVLNKWNVEKTIPNGNMSGDARIDVSPDGKFLLLSIDMGEEHNRKDWDGPLPALWTFELATQRAVRVTAKTLFGWDGCWMDDENILFLSQASGETKASIYRMSINGQNLKRLITNARMPSVSR